MCSIIKDILSYVFAVKNALTQKIVASAIILAIVVSVTTLAIYAPSFNAISEIVCPQDGSLYVLTPVGTRSENFNWVCLRCGHHWTKTYPEDIYNEWRDKFLEPAFVRDYALLYLRLVRQRTIADPLTLSWTGGRETPQGIVGYETYVYRASGIIVTIGYPVVLPENTSYKIKVEFKGQTLWEGELHRREFLEPDITPREDLKTVYDYYGGVGVFEKGIHVIATSCDPLTFNMTGDVYWQILKRSVTVKASTEGFISIIVSRGDHSTGGYTIQIKSFSWLESYPVKLRFEVNFTDPGEGVYVTEAFTNPLVLVPIGKLSPGEYVVEVHIDQYILTFDEQGRPVYTLLQTFREELWTQKFVIE